MYHNQTLPSDLFVRFPPDEPPQQSRFRMPMQPIPKPNNWKSAATGIGSNLEKPGVFDWKSTICCVFEPQYHNKL